MDYALQVLGPFISPASTSISPGSLTGRAATGTQVQVRILVGRIYEMGLWFIARMVEPGIH